MWSSESTQDTVRSRYVKQLRTLGRLTQGPTLQSAFPRVCASALHLSAKEDTVCVRSGQPWKRSLTFVRAHPTLIGESSQIKRCNKRKMKPADSEQHRRPEMRVGPVCKYASIGQGTSPEKGSNAIMQMHQTRNRSKLEIIAS